MHFVQKMDSIYGKTERLRFIHTVFFTFLSVCGLHGVTHSLLVLGQSIHEHQQCWRYLLTKPDIFCLFHNLDVELKYESPEVDSRKEGRDLGRYCRCRRSSQGPGIVSLYRASTPSPPNCPAFRRLIWQGWKIRFQCDPRCMGPYLTRLLEIYWYVGLVVTESRNTHLHVKPRKMQLLVITLHHERLL